MTKSFFPCNYRILIFKQFFVNDKIDIVLYFATNHFNLDGIMEGC